MSATKPEHPLNTSPIRKQLAKRIINYYDQLAVSKELDRSRSASKERSKSRSKSKDGLRQSGRTFDSKTGLDKSPEAEIYEDAEHRRVKLLKLKELMLSELDRAATDGALDPDFETLSKMHPGYPTFMKEFESPEKMLEDHHHTNLKVYLNEKVNTFNRNPDEQNYAEEEDEDEPGMVGGKLYHIVTSKSVAVSNKPEEDNFDFHQRKAKEIRRLQYAAGIGNPKKIVTTTYYAVWVLINGQPISGRLASDGGFQTNNNKDTLIVNEDDPVKVKPKDEGKGQFDKFEGDIKKPKDGEPDCDFIVETPSGQRYPILVNLRQPKAPMPMPEIVAEKPVEKVQRAPERPKTRTVHGANSTILDPITDKKLGRSKSELVGKDSVTGNKVEFAKAVLLDSNNELSIVLLKRLSPGECIVKKADQTQKLEIITVEDSVDLGGLVAKRLILQKSDGDRSPFQKEVYMFPSSFFLQPLRIFDAEFISSECENIQDYHGKTEWRKTGDGPDDEKLFIHFKDIHGKKDAVRVVLDDAYGLNDISDRLDHLTGLARKRYEDYLASLKKKRKVLELDELRFDVVDRKGRKVKVIIRNDSDNEDFSSSEGEGEELPCENAYYHLMVENQKVIPFKRRTKDQRRAEHEAIWKSHVLTTEELRLLEVKVENGVKTTKETVTKSHHNSSSQPNIADSQLRLRKELQGLATDLGINFPNDKMFDSFVQFMSSLPKGIDEIQAARNYKLMIGEVFKY